MPDKNNWPDEIRQLMVDRSEWYDNPQVYCYGYYDGYQKALESSPVAVEESKHEQMTRTDKDDLLRWLNKELKKSKVDLLHTNDTSMNKTMVTWISALMHVKVNFAEK